MSRENLYDDPEFFAKYSELPRSQEGLPGAVEWPRLCAMLPKLDGLRILDLGCGFGAFARYARQQGAASVVAVDRSANMLERARELTSDAAIAFRQAGIEELEFAEGSFDLVCSALVFHYLADFLPIARKVNGWLVPDGRFVFSVEHPVMTAPTQPEWREDAPPAPLERYGEEGARITHWLTPGVRKYHRTVASYVNALIEAGFTLRRLEEWMPTPEEIAANPEWAAWRHRPAFLLVSAEA
ncbi:MAG: class I SAM-dependent methyltransferase [Bacillota bacterium]